MKLTEWLCLGAVAIRAARSSDVAEWVRSILLKAGGSKPKLSPEGEVIAAYGAAMVAAFQILVSCLEENEAVQLGQFPAALAVYVEMIKSNKGDVSDILNDIRAATLD
jgi:hypothetical protein